MNSWEIYSQILSLEGINLVYDETATTASFDINSRTIFVPTFDYMTPEMMQRFVSHEVAHAKYTKYSLEDFRKHMRTYGDLFNVVEDAYIEAKILREFPGLKEIFRTSTKHFIENDLFSINPESISDCSLIERLNIYTKCDGHYDVPFEGIENQFAYRIKLLNSNDDVISLCHDIAEYLLEQKKKQNKPDESQTDESGESEEHSSASSVPSFSAEESYDETEVQTEENEMTSESDETNEEETESKENSSEESDSSDDSEDRYDSIREELVDSISKEFEEKIDNYGKDMLRSHSNSSINVTIDTKKCYKHVIDLRHLIHAAEESYDNFATNNFKKTTYKMVRSLAATADKIFQQKKSANELRNSSNRSTGKLDMKKLGKHRTADNIFRIVRTLPKGKNHGVMILIDFSGSMTNLIKDTIIQAAILAEFCVRNNIKFEIVLFGCHVNERDDYFVHDADKTVAIIMDENTYNLKALLAYGLKFRGTKNCFFAMGSTPTDVALSYVIEELPRWKREVEKTSVYVITDGGYNHRDEYAHAAVINGIKFDISNDFNTTRLIHHNWVIEFLCKYIKQILGSYVSISHIGYEKKHILFNVHPYVRSTVFNINDTYIDDYKYSLQLNGIDGHIYLFKHNHYLREMTFDIRNSDMYMSCNFSKNPFIDQCQIVFKNDFSNNNNNDSNLLTDTFNSYNMYSLFVNNFISEIA